ncbi:MAG TPA: DUF5985 family protein [Rhizomicrobium sp.]|nr:DUF5985 family protein [Rhizomicrobium sp.]
MSSVTYSLCALVALLCAYLLLSAYRRQNYRLLLWSGLCFAGFTLNNVILVLDKTVFLETDLSILRNAVALGSIMILLYGLIWDAD